MVPDTTRQPGQSAFLRRCGSCSDNNFRSERIATRFWNQNGFPAGFPYPVQESGHHGYRKLEVCPAREWAEQGEYERKVEEEFEIARCGLVRFRDNPVGE